MFVKGLSTRHTSVGTFRFGVVYEVDEKNHAVRKHVLPLLDGERPALKKLSKAEAEKEQAAPAQFTPEVTPPDAKATAADLRSALAAAQKAQKEAEAEAQATEARAVAAEAKLAEAETKLAELIDEVAAKNNELAEMQGKLADVAAAKK